PPTIAGAISVAIASGTSGISRFSGRHGVYSCVSEDKRRFVGRTRGAQRGAQYLAARKQTGYQFIGFTSKRAAYGTIIGTLRPAAFGCLGRYNRQQCDFTQVQWALGISDPPGSHFWPIATVCWPMKIPSALR